MFAVFILFSIGALYVSIVSALYGENRSAVIMALASLMLTLTASVVR